jgi:hypothetical protein
LARIFVENTSEGMSQAPGPIPMNNQSMNGIFFKKNAI